ncbi:MAG: PIN/TRAM domain-containing protein [Fimbriimonadaceae bacterium]
MIGQQPRAHVIAIFANLGAILSMSFMPMAIDSIYSSIQNQVRSSRTEPNPNATEKVYEYDRIVSGNRNLSASAQQKALEDFRAEWLATRESGNLMETVEKFGLELEPKIEITETRFGGRSEIASLKGLEKGGVSRVIREGTRYSIYILRQTRVLPVSGNVVPDVMEEPVKGYPGSRQPATLIALGLLGAILGGVFGDVGSRLLGKANERWRQMASGDRVTVFMGSFAGILASIPFLFVFQGLGILGPLLVFMMMVGFSFLGIYALRSMDDILPWANMTTSRRRTGIRILDTNVLIDGRIYDVAKTGFLTGELYVPSFVIQELQIIADSKDDMKRARGKRGLQMLKLMQSEFQIEVGTKDKNVGNPKDPVDTRLVRLAKALGADLVTNDHNLNSVATLQDVRVLNLNDLVLAVRTNVLPGETLFVALNREGQQPGQAVGYLDDGTMVVVERARERIGQSVEITVTQIIQTERGKLVFAELTDDPHRTDPSELGASPRRPRP